jgi:hypothetical protein
MNRPKGRLFSCAFFQSCFSELLARPVGLAAGQIISALSGHAFMLAVSPASEKNARHLDTHQR